MNIISWIFDLSAAKKKHHAAEIKRKASEIILYDRCERKANGHKMTSSQEAGVSS